ncbi:hypothetical protein Dimus_037903 [Dionaea muscipula]
MEYLSRALKKMSMESPFKFHPKCAKLGITHLAFADDIILLSKGELASVKLIMECLQHFASCSGLHMNNSKSSLFCAAMNDRLAEEIRQATGFSNGRLPFKYLGIPINASRLTSVQFMPFLEKISGYINGWLGKTLSYAGRVELIKSVLQGIDCFWLSFLPIPLLVLDKIKAYSRGFLFRENVKISPVAWSTVYTPKKEGGLGLYCLRAWNNALLTSHIWNFHMKTDTLWVKWIAHYYLKQGSFWDWKPGTDVSPLLKKLVVIRDELMEGSGRDGCIQ